MQTTLIDQGLDLMLYGMGTVFVFLTILVFATSLMSRVVNALSKTEANKGQLKPVLSSNLNPKLGPAPSAANEPPSAQVLEAIKLAIKQHRQRS